MAHNGDRNHHDSPIPPTTDSTPTSSSADNTLCAADWAERTRRRAAAARARLAEQRAAFTGTCFECRDTGALPTKLDGKRRYCASCAAGDDLKRRETVEHLAHETARIFRTAGVPLRRMAETFATFPDQEQPALSLLRAFTDGWDGTRGLMLTGAYGTGKTGLLVAALHAVVGRYADPFYPGPVYPAWYGGGRPVYFTTATDLFDRLRAGYEDGTYTRTLERAKSAKLLVLDDLGAEKPTEWVQERLFGIINARYEQELPTFVSTNCGLAELAERAGPRTLERLLEGATVIAVEGRNLRTAR